VDSVSRGALYVAFNGAVFDRPLPPVDFLGLARSGLPRDRGSEILQTVVDSSTSSSRRFEESKRGQKICFDCIENRFE
jgi:hypothetical protein